MDGTAPTRRSGWKVVAAIGGFLVGVATILGVLISLGVISPWENVLAVPDVVGQDATAVEQELRADGFLVEVERVPSKTVPAGFVIDTAPKPGDDIAEDRPIKLYVSSGPGFDDGGGNGTPEPVRVPNVADLPEADALALLDDGGFEVTVQRRFDEIVAEGLAIGTEPAADTEVTDPAIVLIVSDGPAPPQPDLIVALEPGCTLIPGGSLSGADQVTFYFRVENIGTAAFEGSVAVRAQSDTGLGATVPNVSVSDDPASNYVQVDVAPQDYGRDHLFTIAVDPDDSVDERDEGNNGAQVIVRLPPTIPTSEIEVCVPV